MQTRAAIARAEADRGERRARAGPRWRPRSRRARRTRDRRVGGEPGQHAPEQWGPAGCPDDGAIRPAQELRRTSPPAGAAARVRQREPRDDQEDDARYGRAVDLLAGGAGLPGQGRHDGQPGDGAGLLRPRAGRSTSPPRPGGHRRADDDPRQLERADQVVGAGLHAGPGRSPSRPRPGRARALRRRPPPRPRWPAPRAGRAGPWRPGAASMPMDRSRRWASTVKPPTPTRAMSTMPITKSARARWSRG